MADTPTAAQFDDLAQGLYLFALKFPDAPQAAMADLRTYINALDPARFVFPGTTLDSSTWTYDLATVDGLADALISGFSLPITVEKQRMMRAWMACEKGATPWLWNNPLNTTLYTSAVVATVNSDGVRSYDNIENGLRANVATVIRPQFSDIRAAFDNENAGALVQALSRGIWGTSASCMTTELGT